MPSNLLLLIPLVAGYLATHLAHRLSYRSQALKGHRLVFESALAGYVLFGLSFLSGTAVREIVPAALQAEWWRYTRGTPLAGTLLWTLLLSIALPVLANFAGGAYILRSADSPEVNGGPLARLKSWWLASREVSLRAAIGRHGTFMHRALLRAATYATQGEFVGLTLKNRKIYAAFVAESPNLYRDRDGDYVALLPLMSGYRDAETLDPEYTFAYPPWDDGAEARLIIPLVEIESLQLLDWEYFVQLEEPGDSGSESKGQEGQPQAQDEPLAT